MEGNYRDISVFGISHEKCVELCHKAWEEVFNCLCFDKYELKKEGKISIVTKAKALTLNTRPKQDILRRRIAILLVLKASKIVIHN